MSEAEVTSDEVATTRLVNLPGNTGDDGDDAAAPLSGVHRSRHENAVVERLLAASGDGLEGDQLPGNADICGWHEQRPPVAVRAQSKFPVKGPAGGMRKRSTHQRRGTVDQDTIDFKFEFLPDSSDYARRYSDLNSYTALVTSRMKQEQQLALTSSSASDIDDYTTSSPLTSSPPHHYASLWDGAGAILPSSHQNAAMLGGGGGEFLLRLASNHRLVTSQNSKFPHHHHHHHYNEDHHQQLIGGRAESGKKAKDQRLLLGPPPQPHRILPGGGGGSIMSGGPYNKPLLGLADLLKVQPNDSPSTTYNISPVATLKHIRKKHQHMSKQQEATTKGNSAANNKQQSYSGMEIVSAKLLNKYKLKHDERALAQLNPDRSARERPRAERPKSCGDALLNQRAGEKTGDYTVTRVLLGWRRTYEATLKSNRALVSSSLIPNTVDMYDTCGPPNKPRPITHVGFRTRAHGRSKIR